MNHKPELARTTAIEMRKAGYTLRAICSTLYDMGLCNRRGHPYTNQNIHHMMRVAGIKAPRRRMSRVYTHLPGEILEELKDYASQGGITMTAALRNIITTRMKSRKKRRGSDT